MTMTLFRKSNIATILLLLSLSIAQRILALEKAPANNEDAGECANVIHAEGLQTASGVWTISVTVHSDETGWDKYADEWRILDSETRNLLGRRRLAHPHVNEQPFTRSLAAVTLPEMEEDDGIQCLVASARDSVLGYCGLEYEFCRFGNATVFETGEIQPPSQLELMVSTMSPDESGGSDFVSSYYRYSVLPLGLFMVGVMIG